jgi:hypothetical protein
MTARKDPNEEPLTIVFTPESVDDDGNRVGSVTWSNGAPAMHGLHTEDEVALMVSRINERLSTPKHHESSL